MAAITSSFFAMSSTTSTSPLLAKVPAELRNRIYRLALHAQDKIEITHAGIKARMALLQTCKQLREEAIGIYFPENIFTTVFELGSPNMLILWMDAIGDDKIRLLRRLIITLAVSAETFMEYEDRLCEYREEALEKQDSDDDDFTVRETRLMREMFHLPVVDMVAHKKSKPLDKTWFVIGKGKGSCPRGTGFAVAASWTFNRLWDSKASRWQDLAREAH